MRKYLLENGIDSTVDSAGIHAYPEPITPDTIDALKERGLDSTGHEQTKITHKMIDEFDVVVGMAQNHLDFIKEHFGKEVFLFNELFQGENSSITDVEDEVDPTDAHAVKMFIHKQVNYICEAIPKVYKEIKRRKAI